MSTPEVPDFSAVPPSQPPVQQPATDQVEATPRRGRRGLAVAGFATALVIGAVGTTAFVADRHQGADDVRLTSAQTGLGAGGPFGMMGEDGSSATPQPGQPGQPGQNGQGSDPDGDGDGGGWGHGMGGRHGMGGLGMMGPRGALHGELVVPQQDGTGTQTVVVQSGTVTAVSATSLSVKSSDGYTATYVVSSTTRVAARSGGITSLKKGDTVGVLATKSGSTLTAVMVGERPDGLGPRGGMPAPNPSSTGSSGSSSGTSTGT